MKAELAKLIELQKTDTNLRRLKKIVESAAERRANLEQEFERHASSIRDIQNDHADLKKQKSEMEARFETDKGYLERAERNLKNAQNQKEYEAAMREADSLSKQLGQLETEILEKDEAISEVEKILAERKDEIEKFDSTRDAAIKEFETEVKKANSEIAGEQKRRDEVFKTLPTRLAAVFDRLSQRSRDGIAVAEVVNGSCSSCFMGLRPQMFVEVKKGEEIITCENCTRILYYLAPEVE